MATMVRVHGPAVEAKRWEVQDFMQRPVNPNYNNQFSIQPKLDFVKPGATDVIAGEPWSPGCGDTIALGHLPGLMSWAPCHTVGVQEHPAGGGGIHPQATCGFRGVPTQRIPEVDVRKINVLVNLPHRV